jgi:hypothetical protein
VTSRAVVMELDAAPEPEEAKRYLGYPQGRSARARGAHRLAELWPATLPLLAPRGAYALASRPEAEGTGMPETGDTVAVAVVTIGPALEEEISLRTAHGALLDALVLDAIGSAAAEAAADALNLELCTVARSRGLEAAPRVSPGYGAWDTACQPRLLALLPIDELGIRLTSGAMMMPRKSVSFAVRFEEPGRVGAHAPTKCERCGLVRCRHRIAPAEDASRQTD